MYSNEAKTQKKIRIVDIWKKSIHDLTLENSIVLGKIDRTDQEIKCR